MKYRIGIYIFLLMLIVLGLNCEKHPTGSNDEPLEFPDFPETPE